jgi:branched-chain amino acid transport system permease protein
MDYVLHILVMMLIYSILSVSLDLAVGHTGLVSLAHASFYGVGAYASAILCGLMGFSFWVGISAGIVVAALMSVGLSIMSLRLSEDYFAIGTFSFGLVVSSVLTNWLSVTRGPFGIPGVPPPIIFGWTVRSQVGYLVAGATVLAMAVIVVRHFSSHQFGRVIHCIREDEVLAQSFGKNTLSFKVTVFALGACFAAVAGSLYAHYISFVDPTSFSINESILILSIVIVGGPASRFGPIIGAILLVGVPEVLRFAGLPFSVAADLRQILYGGVLVGIVLFRPQGIAGNYEFRR